MIRPLAPSITGPGHSTGTSGPDPLSQQEGGALVRPSSFVAAETNHANGPTPREALHAATKRIEAVEYARGFEAALTRLEMLAAIVPESITKAQLVDMLKREVQACIGEWNATQRPNKEAHQPSLSEVRRSVPVRQL